MLGGFLLLQKGKKLHTHETVKIIQLPCNFNYGFCSAHQKFDWVCTAHFVSCNEKNQSEDRNFAPLTFAGNFVGHLLIKFAVLAKMC